MSRHDAISMRLPCPTPACRGSLELRTDVEPTAVRCPKCGFADTVAAYCAQAVAALALDGAR